MRAMTNTTMAPIVAVTSWLTECVANAEIDAELR